MAINVSGTQEFTDAELLVLYRWALANNAAGQTRMIEGRTVVFPPLAEIRKTIDWLNQNVNVDADGGGIALVEFGEPK